MHVLVLLSMLHETVWICSFLIFDISVPLPLCCMKLWLESFYFPNAAFLSFGTLAVDQSDIQSELAGFPQSPLYTHSACTGKAADAEFWLCVTAVLEISKSDPGFSGWHVAPSWQRSSSGTATEPLNSATSPGFSVRRWHHLIPIDSNSSAIILKKSRRQSGGKMFCR